MLLWRDFADWIKVPHQLTSCWSKWWLPWAGLTLAIARPLRKEGLVFLPGAQRPTRAAVSAISPLLWARLSDSRCGWVPSFISRSSSLPTPFLTTSLGTSHLLSRSHSGWVTSCNKSLYVASWLLTAPSTPPPPTHPQDRCSSWRKSVNRVSCLTLGNELYEETHGLTKQETRLGEGCPGGEQQGKGTRKLLYSMACSLGFYGDAASF